MKIQKIFKKLILNFQKGSKQEHLEMENKKYEKVNLYQQVMNQIEQFLSINDMKHIIFILL